jgi:hypothetical protein
MSTALSAVNSEGVPMTLRRTAAAAGALASSACLLGALAGPALAAAQTFSDRQTQSAVGDVFTCKSGNLTVTAGSITINVHGVQDGRKIFHLTGTVVPNGVRLTDGTHHYVLSGAEWFGGKSLDADGNLMIQSTETDHFVIRKASGGLFAKVQLVEHWSAKHHSFTFDRGSCETPQG